MSDEAESVYSNPSDDAPMLEKNALKSTGMFHISYFTYRRYDIAFL